jgi:hypothetical protein
MSLKVRSKKKNRFKPSAKAVVKDFVIVEKGLSVKNAAKGSATVAKHVIAKKIVQANAMIVMRKANVNVTVSLAIQAKAPIIATIRKPDVSLSMNTIATTKSAKMLVIQTRKA